MAQLFHPSANTIAKGSLFAAVFLAAATGWVYWYIESSPYVTWAGEVRDQPIPFSHEHHVGGLGIDCRYCHTSVEDSGFAGLPPTKTCMTCHSVLWTNAEMLQPVRSSWTDA
ncbi:MAG TPA: cytochrome c3 family protein, partial [Tepidisphaeraceae bacterium]|nr:cytochrome c3 family protein [Tepidisphaeraceae bacterium]